MLRDILKERKISVRQLSEETGISARTLESYVQERKSMSLRNGLLIADSLGIDPHLLIIPER